MANSNYSSFGSSASKTVNVHGYAQWFAVNFDVQVYVDGEKVGQVGKDGICAVQVSEPCEMKFTCHVRTATIHVDPNFDTDIYLSFDRVSGCLIVTKQPSSEDNNNGNIEQKLDKPNIGLDIVSFLFPIVGLILFFVKKGECPNSAKSYLICGICGFVLGLILL